MFVSCFIYFYLFINILKFPDEIKYDEVDARIVEEARTGNATKEGSTYKQDNTVLDK